MAHIDVLNLGGQTVGSLELADEVFAADQINEGLLWEAVKHYRAALRQGTHATKNKKLVSGSGKKLWKQKGTGRARLTGNPLLIDTQRKLLLRYRIVTAVFKTELDVRELEDRHNELIELLESGSAAKLRRLVDTHWRLVIRGHVDVQPGIEDLAEALRLPR